MWSQASIMVADDLPFKMAKNEKVIFKELA